MPGIPKRSSGVKLLSSPIGLPILFLQELIMPIYEYSCKVCGLHFEKLQKSGTEVKPTCPSCESGDVQKEISSFAAPGYSSPAAGCSSGG
jgi:putative FmdB family regulatory protein